MEQIRIGGMVVCGVGMGAVPSLSVRLWLGTRLVVKQEAIIRTSADGDIICLFA